MQKNSPVSRGAIASLLVSLFLFLLIFFILMNSQVKPNPKYIKKAFVSLTANFKKQARVEKIKLDVAYENRKKNKEYYAQVIKHKLAVLHPFDVNIPENVDDDLIAEVRFFNLDLFDDNNLLNPQYLPLKQLMSELFHLKLNELKLQIDLDLFEALGNNNDIEQEIAGNKLLQITNLLQPIDFNITQVGILHDDFPGLKLKFYYQNKE